MMEMQRKFQIAHDAIEAGLIPEDVIIDENNIEHWIVGNKAYSTDGVEEANLDDLETNLSTKDRKILLKERIKKYQEELEKLEAESTFYDDTYQNIVKNADEAYITDIKTDYVETTSIDYEVHITEIEYALDEEDGDPDLPKELTLWVKSDRDKDEVDFDDIVCNAIEDEVVWTVKSFKYKVISSR